MTHEPIAIVGMACLFPGAADLDAYWRNLVGAVDSTGEPPPDWHAERYLDPGSAANDRVYGTRGGWLGDLATFDPLAHGVMPTSVDGGEPDQFLALDVASRALRDATGDAGPRDRSRTGVVVGHGTYVNRGFGNVLQHGIVIDQTLDLLRALHPEHSEDDLAAIKERLKATLPPFNAEMAPGLVPNVLTGRIANRLDLMGPNYTVDAACASSLVAVDHALRELREGACDLMLAGGVHTSTTAPILQIFCQLGAISRAGSLRPFDERADGTLLGEGAGFVALKRLSDAVAHGDRVYAVVRSVGIASDGRASGLLAPRVEGEELALRRAYDAAGVDPSTVGLVEAHGTGTDAGDEAELASLRAVFGTTGPAGPSVALGSVKSMIAHLLPAAGIAGIIKVALALHHGVLPPSLHCEEPRAALRSADSRFYLSSRPRPWVHGGPHPRRAGVNAFGFGGINAHAVLEEASVSAASTSGWPAWPAEPVAFGAADDAGLAAACARMRESVSDDDSLLELARRSWAELPDDPARRLAVVATSVDDLRERLRRAEDALTGPGRLWDPSGTFLADRPLWEPGATCFLFPGEGSPYPDMLAEAAMAFPDVRRWFDVVDAAFVDHERGFPPSRAVFPPPGAPATDELLHRMDVGPESLFAASQGLLALLARLRVDADAVLGHSSGEWSALVAAGCLPVDDVPRLVADVGALNRLYRDLDAHGDLPDAVLLTVGGVRTQHVDEVVGAAEGELYVAVANCPHQSVLCGTERAIERAASTLGARGAVCERLPFGRAYHTPLFAEFGRQMREHLDRLPLRPPERRILSCATAADFPRDATGVRDLAAAQWSRPVLFQQTVEALYAGGARVFVEVGPSASLTAFVRDTLRGRPHLAVACDQRELGIRSVPLLVAQLFAHGVPLDPAPLFAGREPAVARTGPRLATHLPDLVLDPADAPAVAPVAAPEAPAPHSRDEAMRSHLALMQRFLDVQSSVLGALRAGAVGAAPPEPDLPYVDEVLEPPGAGSARVRCVWDLERDPALADHTLEHGRVSASDPTAHGLPVVPLTMSLELAAEAALAAAGSGVVVAVEDVVALRWTALEHGPRPVVATAEPTAPGRYDVRLEQEPGGELLLTAQVLVATRHPSPPTAAAPGATTAFGSVDLYGPAGLFHGPAFHVVRSLDGTGELTATATLTSPGQAALLGRRRGSATVLDAALLDGPGQVLAHWLAQRTDRRRDVFPVRLAALELYGGPDPAPAWHACVLRIERVDDDGLVCDADILGADGRVLARMTGWQDVRLEAPSQVRALLAEPLRARVGEAWAPPGPPEGWGRPVVGRRVLLPADELRHHGELWVRVLAHAVLHPDELPAWHRLPEASPRRTDWLAGRLAAKEAVRDLLRTEDPVPALRDIRLEVDAQGRPVVSGRPGVHVSITHSGGEAVALASTAPVGVDLQPVGSVPPDAEGLAFGEEERARLDELDAAGRPVLAARLWVAKEAASKARGTGLPLRPAELATRIRTTGDGSLAVRVEGDGAGLDTWTDVIGPTAYAACLVGAQEET